MIIRQPINKSPIGDRRFLGSFYGPISFQWSMSHLKFGIVHIENNLGNCLKPLINISIGSTPKSTGAPTSGGVNISFF